MHFLLSHKSKILSFLLILLISFPAFSFLLRPGYYNMHDDMQMIRQLELEKCLKDGQVPCRWTPDLGYGYGYPLFNFYPPMPYFVGQVFRTFGMTYVDTVKATAITQYILSSVFIFILASNLFGALGGFTASALYAYSPYHSLNIYIRGAMNEAWAAVFFPLIFYFSKKLIEKPNLKTSILFSLSFLGLMLSHNPMVLTFSIFLSVWCLFWFLNTHKFKVNSILKLIKYFSLSAILSLGLASFYTLPVFAETKLVQIDSMFNGYYHYSAHFVSLYQLFIRNFWGEGASVWGTDDGMSFMVGYIHWLIPVCLLILLLLNFLKTKKIDKFLFVGVFVSLLGFSAAFFAHERSSFIWRLVPTIQKIQFPWRFLNHTSFLLSLSGAALPAFISKKFGKILGIIAASFLIITALISNYQYFRPLQHGPITDSQKFSGKAWIWQITSGIYDYLPKTTPNMPLAEAKPYIDEVIPSTVTYNLSGEKKGTDWMMFNIDLSGNAKVLLSQFYFPDFRVFVNGNQTTFSLDPKLGRISVDLPPGTHQVYLKLYNTPIRTISNVISLISWSLLAIYFLQPLWSKLLSKK